MNEIEEDFLTEILAKSVPKVEERFVKEALQFLREDLHFFNVFWINNIAKTVHNSVDIIDDVTKKVILRVPPMITLVGSGRGLGSDLASVKNELENTPALRNILVGNAIAKNLAIVSDTSESIEGWKELFVRYGYQDLLDPVEENDTNNDSNILGFFDD